MSPEFKYALKNNILLVEEDIFKQDVFSLGLTFLEVITLKRRILNEEEIKLHIAID